MNKKLVSPPGKVSINPAKKTAKPSPAPVPAYISFAIPGTKAVIVATKGFKTIADAIHSGPGLTVVTARTPASEKAYGTIKLDWTGLNTSNGKPHTNPLWVIRRFNELRKAGWKIEDAAFRKKHFAA